jgi:rod shape-determining protein MreD
VSSLFRSKFRSIEIVTGPALWPSIGWVVLALFAQTVLAPSITVRHAVPSFTTIAIVLYALRTGGRRGAVLGIVAGALTDAVAGTAGGWTVADGLIGLASGAVAREFFADGILPPSFLVAAAVFVRDALFWIVMAMEGYPRGFGTTHFHASVWQAALTGLCALAYLYVRTRFFEVSTRIERYG